MVWNVFGRSLVKSRGHGMLPCGTPQVIGSWADVEL